VVLYGIPNDPFELDQRGGRGGRDGEECLVLMIAEKWALNDLAASDPEYTPGKKEQRTKPDILTYTRCKTCRRRQLANHNNDFTPGGKFYCACKPTRVVMTDFNSHRIHLSVVLRQLQQRRGSL
jgi:superfamily II DNA helicase RecQ